MNTKIVLKEEDEVQEQWYANAKEQTLETLPAFLRHLSEDYVHDYGTIVHALAAGAIATTWALNHTDTGGITGFQASAIMWEYMKHWAHISFPARLLKFEDMLYPQYKQKFDKVMDRETWSWLQDQANINLKKEAEDVAIEVRNHWEAIAAGRVPFGYSVKAEE
jgi:hypothetical protein